MVLLLWYRYESKERLNVELINIIISSILSGILGVVISTYYHNRAEKRKWKLEILEQLLGNRYDIQGEKFTEAINSVFVVFNDSKDVLIALKEFHQITLGMRTTEQANQKLLDLFKAMCNDLNIETSILTDNFLLQPFNIRN
ncbi:DUF6680 family protein [Clostridium perfringens]|uniref:DUF6680 family protein n=1 Tax=Clostridium perfringens TaxID=1502 RepID=UPI001C858C35|nr:DUF6680 family protein [Clostridium perfringens]